MAEGGSNHLQSGFILNKCSPAGFCATPLISVGVSDMILSMYCFISTMTFPDRIPSTTPGAEPPRDARDSGSARSHSTHLETSSSDRP